MSLVKFDPNNDRHVAALNFFKLTAYPKCSSSTLPSDIGECDFLLREYVINKLKLNVDDEDVKGCSVSVVNANPENFEVKFSCAWEEQKVAVTVSGKLRVLYESLAVEPVFVFNPNTIKSTPIDS